MGESATRKIKAQSIYRFNDKGMGDVNTEDVSEALHIRKVDYDGSGNVLRETDFSEDGEEAELLTRTYNEKGQLTQLEHFFEGQLSERTFFEYDANGLLSKEKLEYADGGVLITTYSYDENKNVTESITHDAEGELD